MKKILLACTIFAMSFSSAFSIDAVYLLKGKIVDAETKKPLGIELQLKSNKNRLFRVKSNSTDGSFQQVLPPGAKYTYMFKGYFCDEFVPYLDLKPTNNYDEIERVFEVRKIKEGDLVMTGDLFKANDTTFADVNDYTINSISESLNFQKNLEVKIYINIEDCNFKTKKIKVIEPGAKKAKQVTITPAEQAKTTIEARIRELKKAFKEKGIRTSGVEFIPVSGAAKDKKKKSDINDIKIVAVKLANF